MKKKRFSVEQIVGVLKQAEVGIPVGERVRQVEISEQTFYRWKKKYEKLEVDPVLQLKQLQEEKARLKRLVADLTLDQAMLQDVLERNSEAFVTPPIFHVLFGLGLHGQNDNAHSDISKAVEPNRELVDNQRIGTTFDSQLALSKNSAQSSINRRRRSNRSERV